MDSGQKAKLSKTILDMKFMKKSKERVEKEEDDAEGQLMYGSAITEEMRKGSKYAFIEVSMSQCKDLIEGHMSFGGFNPDIEKAMEAEYSQRVKVIEKEKEAEISDFEMANRMNPLVSNIGKKFQPKKERGDKRKFLKPSDDI